MAQGQKPTMSVPEAGQRYFGLGCNSSYAAAARGDLPTIKVGGRIFVSVRHFSVGWPKPAAAKPRERVQDRRGVR